MSILEKAQQLQQMMEQGQMNEAFEQFYHEDVRIIEGPSGEVRNGKQAQREAIKEWQSSIKEVHGAGVGSICSNEANNTTTAESWIDVTFQNGNRWKMEEVAIQKWQDEQIIEEKFYYNMPGQ